MNTKDYLEAISQILEVPSNHIDGSSKLEDLGWDSLCDLELVSFADKKLKKVISSAALGKADSVADLIALLEKP